MVLEGELEGGFALTLKAWGKGGYFVRSQRGNLVRKVLLGALFSVEF